MNTLTLPPHFSIAALDSAEEASSLARVLAQETAGMNKPPMLAVPFSFNPDGLRVIPRRAERSYSLTGPVSKMFSKDSKTLNVISYSNPSYNAVTADRQSLIVDDCQRCIRLGGERAHVFEIDVASLSERTLQTVLQIKGCPKLVLRIGYNVLQGSGGDPDRLARWLARFDDVLDGIVLDRTEYRGESFMPDSKLFAYLRAFYNANLPFQIGVSGDIGPQSLSMLETLIKMFPRISIHARRMNEDIAQAFVTQVGTFYSASERK